MQPPVFVVDFIILKSQFVYSYDLCTVFNKIVLYIFQLAGQIDMNLQSDLMAAFEESL